jgi:hypothetical protein
VVYVTLALTVVEVMITAIVKGPDNDKEQQSDDQKADDKNTEFDRNHY